MKPIPWKSVSGVEPDRDYVFLVTFFHLKSVLTTARFLRTTRAVIEQLEAGAPGLVGYSLLARPLSRRYWTLSVWDEGRALMRFVRDRPHLTAVEDLAPRMRAFDAVRWTGSGAGYPPTWQEALRRLDEKRAP